MSRVLLISPPWRSPFASSLALATLRPLLERAGIAADELHGSVLFPLTGTPHTLLEQYSAYLFAPHLYPSIDRDALLSRLIQRHCDDVNYGGLLVPPAEATPARLGIDEAGLRRTLLQDMEKAGECIERCAARADGGDYDIVGFSTTFEAQIPAALAIAQRLKQRRPELRIILGGAACFESQGDGLCSSFRVLDAVCHSEGEGVIVPLIRALRGEASLRDVPGIAFMERGLLRHNPSPPLVEDLDALPVPDYGPYLSQYQTSAWSHLVPPKLFFETSRGCWWGQKHLCTFCGLNAEGLTFRKKSPERALQEIRHLYEHYESPYLQATDNILDMGYLRTVLPGLAATPRDPGRPLQIFFEIKSNLRRDQVQALADGGVVDVQPGIESFSDDVLRLMDKGATGLGQVQFIKWAYESGIGLIYNLLLRNPGERPDWYRRMTELIPFIEHLPPPTSVVNMQLERFSRYHTSPAEFGIENVRPMPHYADLYPDPRVDLSRIAYVFSYDHPMQKDDELRAAHRAFVRRVDAWQRVWRQRPASYAERQGMIVIRDGRAGAERLVSLSGPAAEVFRYLDQVRNRGQLRKRFAALDEDLLDCLLERLLHNRWIARDGERYLAVLPNPERARAAAERAIPVLGGVQAAAAAG